MALVYFRSAYAPEHYKSQIEWDALLHIEMSRAIKCPSVGTFLAGMKKIQQYIACEEHLKKLFADRNDVSDLLAVFARFYQLDSERVVDMVLKNPHGYVLKPQREGGGNNFYDDALSEILLNIKAKLNGETLNIDDELYHAERYIVMERLAPRVSHNYLITAQAQQRLANEGTSHTPTAITNEFGIYGVMLTTGDEVLINEMTGYAVRAKLARDNEGGIMVGMGALNSIYLVD